MKTKLLKKVRKEWAIYRIDSVGNSRYYKELSETLFLSFPFYISSEVEASVLGHDDMCHQTFQEAKDRILEEVKSKYEPIFRKDKCTPIITKVWHI